MMNGRAPSLTLLPPWLFPFTSPASVYAISIFIFAAV